MSRLARLLWLVAATPAFALGSHAGVHEARLESRAAARVAGYPALTVHASAPSADGTVHARAAGEDGGSLAWATYRDDTNTSGWAWLELHTNETYDDVSQAYAAGVLEASLTAGTIHLSLHNSGGISPWAPKLAAWLEANDEFIRASVAGHTEDEYWHQVGLTYAQIDGIWAGVGRSAAALPYWVIVGMSLGGDLEDLSAAVGGTSLRQAGDAGHCSALVSLLADGSDVKFGQVTWSSFESMLRIYKLYDFRYSRAGQRVPGAPQVAQVSFSGYPGSVFSGDDYYLTSSGLAALETTIGNDNATLCA